MHHIQEIAKRIIEAEFGRNVLLTELKSGQINTVFRIHTPDDHEQVSIIDRYLADRDRVS